jgi:hypothetical protein
MSWDTPKVDWGVDVVGNDDFNRIEGNTVTLHKGGGQETLLALNPTVPAGSGLLDINETDTAFKIKDIGEDAIIKLILTVNRQPGNQIVLINASAYTLYLIGDVTPTGNYKPIHSNTSANTTINRGEGVQLVYDGGYWYVVRNTV